LVAQSEGEELGLEVRFGEVDLRSGLLTLAWRETLDACVRLRTCLREEARSTLKRSEDSPVLVSMVIEPRSMVTALAARRMRARRRRVGGGELIGYVVAIYNYRY
jgi:hypothetical protein